MTYTGKVERGVVVFDGDAKPRDGARVQILEFTIEVANDAATKPANDAPAASIWEELDQLAGTAKDLPSDMAANHDHYIHGTPKRDLQ
jgi:hypothetical protein